MANKYLDAYKNKKAGASRQKPLAPKASGQRPRQDDDKKSDAAPDDKKK